MEIAVWKKLTSSDAAKIELVALNKKAKRQHITEIIHTFYK